MLSSSTLRPLIESPSERFRSPPRTPGEVLVDVRAISLNRGELTRIAKAPDGWRPGWDFAGAVTGQGCADLRQGTRVVGLLDGGAWAERIAAPTTWLAEVPHDVTDAQAAARPATIAHMSLGRIGLPIRLGLHAGEVERRGEDARSRCLESARSVEWLEPFSGSVTRLSVVEDHANAKAYRRTADAFRAGELVALVRAGATFMNGKLVERSDQQDAA